MSHPVSVTDLLDENGRYKLLKNLPKRVRARLLRVKADGDGRIYSFAFKPLPMMERAPAKRWKKRITKAMERKILKRLNAAVAQLVERHGAEA
jgi:hypothetical protein